jgi:hypothetical protein
VALSNVAGINGRTRSTRTTANSNIIDIMLPTVEYYDDYLDNMQMLNADLGTGS